MNEGSRPASRGYALPLERAGKSGVSLSGEEEGCEPWYESNPTSLARQRSPSEVFYPVIKTLPAAELFRDVLEDDFEVS